MPPDNDKKINIIIMIDLSVFRKALSGNWESRVLGLLSSKDIVLQGVNVPSELVFKLRILSQLKLLIVIGD